MADNVTLPGTGVIIASDEGAGGEQVQLVKLAYSADASLTPLLADAKGLEVQQGTAADFNVTEASASAIKTAVEALDNSVDGNYLNVNLNITGTDLVIGTGTEAAALRVTLATDSTGLISVDDNAASLTVDNADITSTKTAVELIDDTVYVDDADWSDSTSKHLLVGGLYQSAPQTITDGDVGPLEVDSKGSLRVVAMANSGVDIGDVDVASVPAPLNIVGNGAAATALRVTLANDSTCIATVALGATDNAVLDVLASSIYIDDADWTDNTSLHTLVGGVYQSAPHSVTDGDVSPLEVDAKGSLMIVGNIAHDVADASYPVKIGGKAVSALPAVVAANDRANCLTDLQGRLIVSLGSTPAGQISIAKIYTTAETGGIIYSPTAGTRFAITSVVVGTSGTTAGRLVLWGGADGDTTYTAGTDQAVLIASFVPSATSYPGLVFCPSYPVYLTADHNLMVTTATDLDFDICVHGFEVL